MDRRIKLITLIIIAILLFSAGGYVFAEEETPKEMIECSEPDGESGYYTNKPVIYIHKIEPDEILNVRFLKPDGEVVEVVLEGEEESLCIDEEWFQEGKHVLEVWKENEEEEVEEENRVIKEFYVDTKQPGKVMFSYERENEDEILCFGHNTYVDLEVEDEGSGIKEMYYQMEGEEIVKTETNHLRVGLPIDYAGSITAWAIDQAGNKSETTVTKYVVTEKTAPEILLTSKDDLQIWNHKDVMIDISVKEKEVLSGIARISCYVNGEIVQEKVNTALFVAEDHISFTVGVCAEVIVEAEDYAGNIINVKQEILIDKEAPQIYVTGINDKMITGESVHFVCEVEDVYQLQSAEVNILWRNEDDEEKLLENGEWEKENKNWKLSRKFEKDGIYYMEILAKDMAGNKSVQKYQFVIDKTNPVIQYVDELQGKYLKQFNWEYGLSDMILDFTHYTYEIRLDGKLRNVWITEKSEGKHIFSVQATDSAGNISEAKAEFIVDHTSPVILYNGIENNMSYEEKAEVVLSTKEENDKITEILINGQSQKLDSIKERCKFTFQEIGKYELSVKAEDRAGNVTIEKTSFEVKKKPTILEKIFEVKKPERKGKAPAKQERDLSGLYTTGILGSGMIILCVIIRYKQKKSHKREDAG